MWQVCGGVGRGGDRGGGLQAWHPDWVGWGGVGGCKPGFLTGWVGGGGAGCKPGFLTGWGWGGWGGGGGC